MDHATAQDLAEAYVAFFTEGDLGFRSRFSPGYTARARHVGSSHPRMRGVPVKGNEVTWPQVHVFRFDDGLVAEHGAVRDDLALLDSARA